MLKDISVKPAFGGVETFEHAVSQAKLLSCCGGPYPNRQDIVIVGSCKEALGIIADAWLDPFARHELQHLTPKASSRLSPLHSKKPSDPKTGLASGV
jgi:hypothetical protein